MPKLNCGTFEQYLEKHWENEKYLDVHYIFKFQNGYYASVIMTICSYGHENNQWELAIMSKNKNGKVKVVKNHPLMIPEENCVGYLTDEEVRQYLMRIKNLKKPNVGYKYYVRKSHRKENSFAYVCKID